ncbi:MAG: peptidase M14 [Rhodothermales bacterium]|nr:peptidase M14 [Rhodothermales bacterium]
MALSIFRLIGRFAIVAFALPPIARAQELPLAVSFPPVEGLLGYDAGIPIPDAILGHRLGSRHTEPHQVVDYFEATEKISDRVVVRRHALSYEGRPLIHAIVTSPSNHARLERIRADNLTLSDSPDNVSRSLVEQMPAIVLMSYSVHGNEASGTEAALLLLYHLAAGTGPSVDAILDRLVVIIDPMLNPDGRSRFTTWANRNRGRAAVSDPQDREHNEPWPGGRTNHYFFDLNRDYLPAQHPETRGRLSVFHHWRPQVVTDFHEMGSEGTYFFQPGIPSRTNPNTSRLNQELTAEIAKYHAQALDLMPALYYSEETFDDFYYGKWSSYPDISGAVGILFEQASSRGLARETRGGDLHYATTVRNQFATSLSTLKATVQNRVRLLEYQRDFYSAAARETSGDAVKGFLVGAGSDRSRIEAFADLMTQHRIEVFALRTPVEFDGTTYAPDASLYIPRSQPQSRLIDALFERRTEFPDSIFYDVSAWTLPLAFDLAVKELTRIPGDMLAGRWTLEDGRSAPAEITVSDAVAYCLDWNDFYSARALVQLLEAGADARVATQGFRATTARGDRSFEAGTIIVTRGTLPSETLRSVLGRITGAGQFQFHSVTSALTVDGPDLGSPGNKLLTKRRIALITGAGTSSYRAGEVWHLLSERFEVPVSLLDAGSVTGPENLTRYTTLVVAGGRYPDLPADVVNKWVSNGGHLIATSDASLWAIANGFIDADTLAADLDSLLIGVPYAERSRTRGAHYIGGAILNTVVDQTHPLAFGLGKTLPVFRQGHRFMSKPRPGSVVVAQYAEEPVLSGYVPDEIAELTPQAASVVTRSHGKGQVILFAENPNFRGFWFGAGRMFINAVFLAEAL